MGDEFQLTAKEPIVPLCTLVTNHGLTIEATPIGGSRALSAARDGDGA